MELSEQRAHNPYLVAAAPLALVAAVGLPLVLISQQLHWPPEFATGLAAIPGAVLSVRLAKLTAAPASGQAPAGQPQSGTGAARPSSVPPTATRPLAVVTAALAFMVIDLGSQVMALGSLFIWPSAALHGSEADLFNAYALRGLPIFVLGCLAVSIRVTRQLGAAAPRALVAATATYAAGNALQNILISGSIDGQYTAWLFAYVVAALLAGRAARMTKAPS